jgi:hypothetical protein
VTVCEDCARGFQQAQGELIELSPAALETAKCDAQHIGSVRGAHVGGANLASPNGVTTKPARATQDITPAVRRAVLRRDAHCCVVPGCRHHGHVDLHHLSLRSDGGSHGADNLVLLCTAHHTAFHRGKLSIAGSPATGLVFRHAEGSAYGQPAALLLADVYAKAFSILRNMSFREPDTRRALDQLRREGLAQDADLQTLVRATLRVLTSD